MPRHFPVSCIQIGIVFSIVSFCAFTLLLVLIVDADNGRFFTFAFSKNSVYLLILPSNRRCNFLFPLALLTSPLLILLLPLLLLQLLFGLSLSSPLLLLLLLLRLFLPAFWLLLWLPTPLASSPFAFENLYEILLESYFPFCTLFLLQLLRSYCFYYHRPPGEALLLLNVRTVLSLSLSFSLIFFLCVFLRQGYLLHQTGPK